MKKVNVDIVRFICAIIIGLAFFVVAACLVSEYRGVQPVNERIVTLTKIFVFAGIFFFVLAFGHALPAFIAGKKCKGGTVVTSNLDFNNEANMRMELGKYIPSGENMIAGIHAICRESSVTSVFDKCVYMDGKLLPDSEGGMLSISKTKYSTYDLYICITESCFVVADCDKYKYLYEYNKKPVSAFANIKVVESMIDEKNIGKCFLLEDIKEVIMKKGLVGTTNCVIKMKDESYFKLIFPSAGDIGEGMPNYEKYRNKIIEVLGRKGV